MIHFMADPHANHEAILKMCNRPFETIAEHDHHIIDRTNMQVRRTDTLWVLGDAAWHSVDQWRKRLVCKNVYLVWGNHDRQNFGKWFQATMDVTDTKIGEHHVWLSHYAHAYWPGSHEGWLHLYGHNHAMREETLDTIWPERRSMDCGVDNAKRLLGEYRPFTADEVIDILGSRKGHDDLEFYRAYQSR